MVIKANYSHDRGIPFISSRSDLSFHSVSPGSFPVPENINTK